MLMVHSSKLQTSEFVEFAACAKLYLYCTEDVNDLNGDVTFPSEALARCQLSIRSISLILATVTLVITGIAAGDCFRIHICRNFHSVVALFNLQ